MWKSAVNLFQTIYSISLFLIGYSDFKATAFTEFNPTSPKTCSISSVKLEIFTIFYFSTNLRYKDGVAGLTAGEGEVK